jgi:hypothetical protein
MTVNCMLMLHVICTFVTHHHRNYLPWPRAKIQHSPKYGLDYSHDQEMMEKISDVCVLPPPPPVATAH